MTFRLKEMETRNKTKLPHNILWNQILISDTLIVVEQQYKLKC